MAKLDYFITGNYRTDNKEIFAKNILECVMIGVNYDKLNVGKSENNNDLVTMVLRNVKKNKYEGFHVISIDLSDTNEENNDLSGLKSMLDIDLNFLKKLEAHERSFAMVLYSEQCAHCPAFANSFNYSKNVVYKLEISDLTNEEREYIMSNIIDYANDNNLPSNLEEHLFATPAIIRFENGVPKYISYGNEQFNNDYNYNLLVSIIEGTFNGDSIEYQ